jgi:hypothetical protein
MKRRLWPTSGTTASSSRASRRMREPTKFFAAARGTHGEPSDCSVSARACLEAIMGDQRTRTLGGTDST